MRKLDLPSVAVAALVCSGAFAADGAKIPRLGFAEFGWFPVSDDFAQPPSGPGPVVSDPKHPYYNNQSGRQPTDRVADLTSPILKPWAVERMTKTNQDVLDGKTPFSPRERCMPAGVRESLSIRASALSISCRPRRRSSGSTKGIRKSATSI